MTGTDSSGANAANRRSISRYDLILAIIPVALIGPALFARAFEIGLESGLVIGSVVGALALLDAVLLNPPRGRQPGGSAA